jgi:CRISPR/Cas system CSM-associated protein Csm5 (group 7 of RAMP superfamily)
VSKVFDKELIEQEIRETNEQVIAIKLEKLRAKIEKQ